jgi:hypothetical protein
MNHLIALDQNRNEMDLKLDMNARKLFYVYTGQLIGQEKHAPLKFVGA